MILFLSVVSFDRTNELTLIVCRTPMTAFFDVDELFVFIIGLLFTYTQMSLLPEYTTIFRYLMITSWITDRLFARSMYRRKCTQLDKVLAAFRSRINEVIWENRYMFGQKNRTVIPISSVCSHRYNAGRTLFGVLSIGRAINVENRQIRDGPRKYRTTCPEKSFWFLIYLSKNEGRL